MADIINAIALACGLTSELSKIYIDGVRDIVLASLDGVDDRLDLMPTHEELKRMAQYALIGEGGADHTVTAKDFEPNARYRIVAATDSPKIELGFYEAQYGETFTETISLQGQEAQLGYYTVEILGLDTAGSTGGIRLLLRYEVNGEPQTIYVNPPSGYSVDVEMRTATFTGVDSVYRYKPGTEVIARDGRNVFVRYSANADGTGFTETKESGQRYIGFATAYDAPIEKGAYTWFQLGSDYVLTEADKDEIAERCKYTLPDYWENYLPDKINAIKALQDEGGKDCFSFVVIADMHYEQNIARLAPKIAKRLSDECGIKFVLILGDSGTRNGILHNLDYINTEWDNIEKMIAPISDRLLITDGNHDGSYGATDGDGDGVIDDVHGTGNSAFNFTPQKKYNRIKRRVSLIDGVTFDESGCGYYADDKTAKIRYIVLSTHNNKYEENADGSSKYSNMNNFRYGQSQFDLVIDALNTLEDGWSVLVASHVPLDRSGELLPWGATSVKDDRLVSGEVECWLMADVLNAFVNRTTYSGKFTGTQSAGAIYKNLADKTSAEWLTGYRTSSSGISAEAGSDVTNFLGDGKTTFTGHTIYYKNAKVSAQRLVFYNANKEMVWSCYPTAFDRVGFDGSATEGYIIIDDANEALYTTAVYVRLCLVSGDTAPIITIDQPIEASGDAFDAVSVDVDFTSAKGALIGYFGGHLHKDGAWGNTYTWDGRLKQCDFWTIATRCDGHNENDSALYAEKVAGTITEQSFDVFTVNKATRTIHATKIGAGADREIRY